MTDQVIPTSGQDSGHDDAGKSTSFNDLILSDRREESDDRRKTDVPAPPDGIERRQWQDRRKMRATEGRERYLDMVQRERTMFLDQGVSRSTEQLLDMAGATNISDTPEEEGVKRERATGDQLRSVLPVQALSLIHI